MTNEKIIREYHKILVKNLDIKNLNLKTLKDKEDKLFLELEISIRIGHKMEEEFIRSKLETLIDMIDMHLLFDFNINKKTGIE